MTDERIKELMTQVGMPDSLSLYTAFKQIINEVTQELKPAWPKSMDSVDPVIRDLMLMNECTLIS